MEHFTWAVLAHIHLVYVATYGKSRETKILSQVFSEQIVSSFRMFASVDRCLQETGTFAVNRHSTGQGWSVRTSQFDENIWEQSLHKHLHSWSPSQFGSSSCLELCRQEAALAFLLVEGGGCRPQQLPSSKPILRWFVHQSTEKPDFPAVVLFMDEPHFTWVGIFQQPQQPCLGTSKSSCCIQHCFVVDVWVGIVYDFLIRLTCYADGSVDRFTACFCGPLCVSGLRTSHRHLQWSLDWTGQACGLAFHVTRTSTSGLLSMGPRDILDGHVASWFWRVSYCPYHCGSSNHQAATWHFWAHMSISAALLLAVYWGWRPYVWTCALNWYEINIFFLEYLRGFAWFITLGRHSHFDGLWHCKTTCPTYSCLTINLLFWSPYHFTKLGHGGFLHCVYNLATLSFWSLQCYIGPRTSSLKMEAACSSITMISISVLNGGTLCSVWNCNCNGLSFLLCTVV